MPLLLPFPQNLLRVGSALLDMGNKRHWELIQQTEGGTAQLLRHFEEYARALARNMPQTYLSPFTIVTPNIGQWGHAWPEGCEGVSAWNIGMLGTCVPGDTHVPLVWCWGHGHGCTWGMYVLGTWTCAWEHECVLRGCVCVGDTDTCLGTQLYIPGVCVCTRTCELGMCVHKGTCAGSMHACVMCTWEHVLGTWIFVWLGNVFWGMWVCLEACVCPWGHGLCVQGSVGAGYRGCCVLCVPGLVGAGVSGCQDPWPLGSVGAGVHGPGLSGC